MTTRPANFVVAHTMIDRPALTPEITLHLTTELMPLWHAISDLLAYAGAEPPFRAFVWPGGQALARYVYVMDNLETVAGRRVLDIATGSDLVAIAAAMGGASSVNANDFDPMSLAAVALNAELNNVAVTNSGDNLTNLSTKEDWDIVLTGDVFYNREMSARFAHWLCTRTASGALVLIGNPNRAYLPTEGLERIRSYDVRTSLNFENATVLTTTIWRIS